MLEVEFRELIKKRCDGCEKKSKVAKTHQNGCSAPLSVKAKNHAKSAHFRISGPRLHECCGYISEYYGMDEYVNAETVRDVLMSVVPSTLVQQNNVTFEAEFGFLKVM